MVGLSRVELGKLVLVSGRFGAANLYFHRAGKNKHGLSRFPLMRLTVPARSFVDLCIVWLAVHTFLGSLKTDPASSKPLGFIDGLLLQLLNPKVIIYGLTLYATFLAAISGHAGLIALSAVSLAIVGFAAISLWAFAGTTFSRLFQRPVLRRVLAGVLSLLLLYSAAESSGLMKLL